MLRIHAITSLLLLCSLALVAAGPPLAAEGSHIIVIDAGSSGSRIHVYDLTWKAGKEFPIFSFPDARLKTSPGLSSFGENPQDAGPSLKKLMEFAVEKVPQAMRKDTPVIVSATAGLRMLKPETAEAILESCYAWLKQNTEFKVEREHVVLLSGQQEGAYGWLAVNFLANRLDGMDEASKGTLGTIEVGGASAQVTFRIPDDADKLSSSVYYPLKLGHSIVWLYAHSYLGSGLEQARKRFNDNLGDQASDPCMPTGYHKDESLPYQVFFGRKDGPVHGAGDFAQCKAGIDKLFDKDQSNCQTKPCAFDGVHQPSIFTSGSINFIGFENFFHTAHGVSVPHMKEGVSVQDLESAGKEYCSRSWNEIVEHKERAIYPNLEENNKFRYCFGLAFLSGLVHTGLGVPETKSFPILGNMEGVDIEWAIGQALLVALALKSGAGPSVLPGVSGRYAMILILAFAGGAVMFLLSVARRRSITRKGSYAMVEKDAENGLSDEGSETEDRKSRNAIKSRSKGNSAQSSAEDFN